MHTSTSETQTVSAHGYNSPASARPVLLYGAFIPSILHADLSSPILGRFANSMLSVIQYVLRNDRFGKTDECGRGHETTRGVARLIEGRFTIRDNHVGPVVVGKPMDLKLKWPDVFPSQEHPTALTRETSSIGPHCDMFVGHLPTLWVACPGASVTLLNDLIYELPGANTSHDEWAYSAKSLSSVIFTLKASLFTLSRANAGINTPPFFKVKDKKLFILPDNFTLNTQVPIVLDDPSSN